jgi:hypothetical protein
MGSAPVTNTIGITLVAALAANDAGKAAVKITATLRSIKSRASAGSRSNAPFAQRYSIATFLPST